MSNQNQHSKLFWLLLAVLFVVSFLASYSLAQDALLHVSERTVPIREIRDYPIKERIVLADKIANFNKVVEDLDRTINGLHCNPRKLLEHMGYTMEDLRHLEDIKELYDTIQTEGIILQVLKDEAPKAKVKEDPKFKFPVGEFVILNNNSLWQNKDLEKPRIYKRAVLWGENVYMIERTVQSSELGAPAGARTTIYEIVSEKNLWFADKEQPEVVEE